MNAVSITPPFKRSGSNISIGSGSGYLERTGSVTSLEEAAKLADMINTPAKDLSEQFAEAEMGRALGTAFGGDVSGASEAGALKGHLGAAIGLKFSTLGRRPGAEFGHLGGEAGKRLGARYGHLGGAPKKRRLNEVEDGKKPHQQLAHELDPRRSEPNAATILKLQEFLEGKRIEMGREAVDKDVITAVQRKCFPGMKVRRLTQLYEDKRGKAKRVKNLELGVAGGIKKKGEHSRLRASSSMGKRALHDADESRKASALRSVYMEVKSTFDKWRRAGQYVDREDLLQEFESCMRGKVAQLKAKLETEELKYEEAKCLAGCEKRIKAHERCSKNREMSATYMQRLFRCRLLRPQRLIHIGVQEERQRVIDSWHAWDRVLSLAAFGSEEELAEVVLNPKDFIENRAQTVLSHSDQMPFWVKLVPGKQLYAAEEVMRKPLDAKERQIGGGSQKASTQFNSDLDPDGMHQLRGESHGNQDKFRITVDLEQVILGWFDQEKTPQADFGLTSVIFTGAHFREDNVDENRCWIEDERYFRDGTEVVHLKGQPVGALGSQILDFRRDHPELFQKMKEEGLRFYQQPAGFEDSIITCWKIQEQQKMFGQTVSLRDMFTGGLSKWARLESFQRQQLASWILGKITAVCQTADCVVIRPIKIKTAQKHVALRRELQTLAQLENTRAVFKCGVYEIMRTLYEVISEARQDFRENDRLLKGIYGLGWLSYRPNLETGKLEEQKDQEWCKDFKLGTHRIQQEWLSERGAHLENGVPKKVDAKPLDDLSDQVEQTYMFEQGTKRSLATWEQMLKDGKITEEEVSEWRDEPWFDMEVSTLVNVRGLEECKELLQTPEQMRAARGIDPNLTSQKQDAVKAAKKRKAHELKKLARIPLRKEAKEQLRALKDEGYSLNQISSFCIAPEVGKAKKGNKKTLRDSMVQKLKKQKSAAKKTKADAIEAHLGLSFMDSPCFKNSN